MWLVGIAIHCIVASVAFAGLYTGLADYEPVSGASELPTSFTWCKHQNRSYCAPSFNQNNPRMCSSSWIHAALHTANDRIKYLHKALRDDIILNRQAVLNCAGELGLGHGCKGGRPEDAFEYMHRVGVGSETCQVYRGAVQTCDAFHVCRNCMPVERADGTERMECWAVKDFTRYFVSKYSALEGEKTIMTEIYHRGPVACVFRPDSTFLAYEGGVWSPDVWSPGLSLLEPMAVELLGWGTARDPQGPPRHYWLARNSWGNNWGLSSLVKIHRGIDAGGIEQDCVAPTIDLSDEDRATEGELVGGMFGRRKKPDWASKEDGNLLHF